MCAYVGIRAYVQARMFICVIMLDSTKTSYDEQDSFQLLSVVSQ